MYPLLLALDGSAEPLPVWQARVREWLRQPRKGPASRGIMTLRSASGVVAGIFFFALVAEGASLPMLVVPLLRMIEPIGGWRGLAAAMRVMEGMASELGCAGVHLCAEPCSEAWQHTEAGLESIGRSHGFVRRSEDWFRPLRNDARSVSPPPVAHP